LRKVIKTRGRFPTDEAAITLLDLAIQNAGVRWLNNLVEQDHRRVKRRTKPMLGFESFRTTRRTLAGVEAMAMLGK
jgi:transposase-like protein